MVRGRPSDPEKAAQQKQQLFEAARQLLQQKSYKQISIRELAAASGLNSAMISYHFGSKEGLFLALIDHMGGQHFSQIQTMLSADDPLKVFIPHMISFLSANIGIARFIHDEVLSESSKLREHFIKGMPRKMATVLPMLIEGYQQQGKFRADLNPKWAAFSLMNLIIMPLIAEPVREQAWGITLEQVQSPEWANHIYQLFVHGCQ